MRGPARILRADVVPGVKHRGTLHEWAEGATSLVIEEVDYKGTPGAVMCYDNPHVHQIGNPGLDAMLAGLAKVEELREQLAFLLLTWPCDPVHAGGDLKESLARLEKTEERRAELETEGAPQAQVEALYDWADGRLDKGQALYRAVRRISASVRTVAICGGGMRYGGSAEVNLMADWIVGDSRSGMCFSESMIGLIPGWAGVGRAITKAGVTNTRLMAQATREARADDLLKIGIYDAVVEIVDPLPRMGRTGDKAKDKDAYAEALVAHDNRVWPRLLLTGLELGTLSAKELPGKPGDDEREVLASPKEIRAEVERRATPGSYSELWGTPLREAKEAIAEIGRPLAPQSVAELDELLSPLEQGGSSFDEDAFVEAEKAADARLYRDLRLKKGIRATLEQKVADFRETDS